MNYSWREELDYLLASKDYEGALGVVRSALWASGEEDEIALLREYQAKLLAQLEGSSWDRDARDAPDAPYGEYENYWAYEPEVDEEYRRCVQWMKELLQNESVQVILPTSTATATKKYEPRRVAPSGVDEDALKEVMAELDAMIGLDDLKDQVRGLVNFFRVQELRRQQGAKTPPLSHHLVFKGAPGTGKTTVARLFGRIYKALGVLPSDKVTEVSRADLVGRYIGETEQKTEQVLDNAKGGVVFIDEAYALFNPSENDFGHAAVATILKRMEDDRANLVVIVAGYPEEMERFIRSNPGLESRFINHISFSDYSAKELGDIFRHLASSYDYQLSPEGEGRLAQIMAEAVAGKDRYFGNGRFARNLLERSIKAQATRLMAEAVTDLQTLNTLQPADLVFEAKPQKAGLGFR